jgi:hypothetical protein
MEKRMHDRGWPSFRESLVPGFNSAGLERLRLDRLQELRAVIDSLRLERSHGPRQPFVNTDSPRRS